MICHFERFSFKKNGVIFLLSVYLLESGSIWTFLGSWIRIQIRMKTYAGPKHCLTLHLCMKGEAKTECANLPRLFLCNISCILTAELGTRTHSCDNATMFFGHKTVNFDIMSTFVVATPLRHQGLHIFRIFLVFESSLRCRVLVIAKIKKNVACHALILSTCVVFVA